MGISCFTLFSVSFACHKKHMHLLHFQTLCLICRHPHDQQGPILRSGPSPKHLINIDLGILTLTASGQATPMVGGEDMYLWRM